MFCHNSNASLLAPFEYMPSTLAKFRSFRNPSRSLRGSLSKAVAAKRIGRFMKGRARTPRRASRYRGIPTALVPYETIRNTNPQKSMRWAKTIFNNTIWTGAGATVAFNGYFNLDATSSANLASGNACPDLASLQGLFGMYKFEKIELTFRLRQLELSDTAQEPELYIRYNYDPNLDLTAGGGVAQINGWENVKTHKFTNQSPIFQYTLYPKVMVPAYSYTGVASSLGWGLSQHKPMWLDLSDQSGGGAGGGGGATGVQHYGVSGYFGNIPTGQSISLDITFHFKTKLAI